MPLTHDDLVVLLLALAALLTTAWILGRGARLLGQPAIVGEILAGVLLGPTILGHLWPGAYDYLFPDEGAVRTGMHTIKTLSIVLFLLMAGMELNLNTIWRQKRATLAVSLGGILVPFAVGFAVAELAPQILGRTDEDPPLSFSLFIATALAISALTVIAKTLMDLRIYRTEFGMVVMSAAVLDDLVGWLLFAVIATLAGSALAPDLPPALIVVLTIAFVAFTITIGRVLIDRLLAAFTTGDGAPIMTVCVVLGLLGAALTEAMGIHAMFGAFVVGAALGNSRHLRQETREGFRRFVGFIFAPLFFATIGLRLDFVEYFDPQRCAVLLALACATKVIGCGLAARWGGMDWPKAWAVGFALNARGAMLIVLAVAALDSHVIGERMFVAVVIMSLVTSIMSAPAIQWFLGRRHARKSVDVFANWAFVPGLTAQDSSAAIHELAGVATGLCGVDPGLIAASVIWREDAVSTGMPHGLALPHARITGIARPVMVVGLAPHGVNFDARDGQRARLIVMLLVPDDTPVGHLETLATLARVFDSPENIDLVTRAADAAEFRALVTGWLDAHDPPAGEFVLAVQ